MIKLFCFWQNTNVLGFFSGGQFPFFIHSTSWDSLYGFLAVLAFCNFPKSWCTAHAIPPTRPSQNRAHIMGLFIFSIRPGGTPMVSIQHNNLSEKPEGIRHTVRGQTLSARTEEPATLPLKCGNFGRKFNRKGSLSKNT